MATLLFCETLLRYKEKLEISFYTPLSILICFVWLLIEKQKNVHTCHKIQIMS